VLIALSNSGETDELLAIVPLVQAPGRPLIAITGNPKLDAGPLADVHLDAGVGGSLPAQSGARPPAPPARWHWVTRWPWPCSKRAALAPRTSPSHPGGALGRRLLTHVRDVMRARADVPTWPSRDGAALLQITRGGMGMTVVLAAGQRGGVFHRRRPAPRDRTPRRPAHVPVAAVMTRNPRAIAEGRLAAEAAKMMEAPTASASCW
jgi:arabinose-5-phosphate isomerase